MARAAIVLGALAVLAIPVAVAASQTTSGLRLLESLYVAVPISLLLGLAALAAARRARFGSARALRPEAVGPVRAARVVAWAGLYAGVTGSLALAVYGLLRWAQ
jgi:hypothetical protein